MRQSLSGLRRRADVELHGIDAKAGRQHDVGFTPRLDVNTGCLLHRVAIARVFNNSFVQDRS